MTYLTKYPALIQLIYLFGSFFFFQCGSKDPTETEVTKEEMQLPAPPPPPPLDTVQSSNDKILLDSVYSLSVRDKESKELKGNINHTKMFLLKTHLFNKNSAKPFYQVPVFFTTDRNIINSTNGYNLFGGIYSKASSYGEIDVTIPLNHRVGEIDKKQWYQVFANDKDSTKFMTFKNYSYFNEKEFYQHVLNQIKNDNADALVFIPGYNTSFNDGILRAAQLKFDLGFKGPAILYSWPSNGKVEDYLGDENNIELTINHLSIFLDSLILRVNPQKLNIIAHSLGNRALLKALTNAQTKHPNIKFNQIILAAPDIDKTEFEQNIAPFIIQRGNRVTIYSSQNDRALLVSEKVHASIRLGRSDAVFPGIETVDISKIKCEDIFKHSCFAEARAVIQDIVNLLLTNSDPQKRRLIPVENYWEIK